MGKTWMTERVEEMQGWEELVVPPLADYAQVELTVGYNACVYSLALTEFSETEMLLTQTIERALQVSQADPVASDPPVFWRAVLKSLGNTALDSCVQQLLCLQWALWLSTYRLKTIQELQEELSSLSETLPAGDYTVKEAMEKSPKIPLVVLDPRRLGELLQICTLIAQGAERLSEGQNSEALSALQRASSLPAPRVLLAYIHFISGSCLAHMSRPQMALQCYRKALETDSHCVCALYQSMLIYKNLGNTQAEIQALHLLHSTLMLPPTTESVLTGTHPLSPSLLLRSQSLSSLLSVPSALTVLHSLALKCVLHGRVSEGVEHYLDLLAAFYSEDQHALQAEDPPLPRIPELYLETGAALLMVQRTADCMTLCEEVISMTLELLPERLVLEEPEERCEAGTGAGCVQKLGYERDKVAMLLWTGAAYLLRGHCHTHLKDWKQAVTDYTRCVNLLVKVRFKKKGLQPQIPVADVVAKQGTDLFTLQRLKGLSLAGRGISFIHTDQLREALRDLQLSLQAFPECVGAGLWCGEVLWRLNRRQEAAACWERTWSFTKQSLAVSLPVYLQEPQTGPLLISSELRRRIEELVIPSQPREG
ncbi:hypothetical protein LDENG_00286720 [Lucifuga dentata]|nr:hypothetical protein LDENG_00286720 [Lucifuga dentata]